jgi:hypothetical protein
MLKLLSDTMGWSLVQSATDKSANKAGENTMARKKSDDMDLASKLEGVNITSDKPLSSREEHEKALWDTLKGSVSAKVTLTKLRRLIIRRCKNGYLFDCVRNREILADDPWLQDVWQWIEGKLFMLIRFDPAYNGVLRRCSHSRG